jgi:hypothetical protein
MLFVCRECGWETENSGPIPPLACERCGSADGQLGHAHAGEPEQHKKPIDASAWTDNAARPHTNSSGVLSIRAPHGVLGLSARFLGILGLLGLVRRPTAHLDVWEFNPHRQRISHRQRRGSAETVADSFSFAAVVAVQLTRSVDEDLDHEVHLILKSGRPVFISNDPEHAAKIAAFLGVRLRKF